MSLPSESTPLLLSTSNDANGNGVSGDQSFAKDAVAQTESGGDGEAQLPMRSDGGSDDECGHSLTVAKKSKEVRARRRLRADVSDTQVDSTATL
jgi:hypothetical protein